MKIRNGLLLALGFAALAGSPDLLQAEGRVEIELNSDGEAVAQELGIDTAQFASDMEARLSEAFDALRAADYLRAISDAVAFSNRGIGVDYAFGNNAFEFGMSANISVSLGDKGLGEIDADRPVGGVAPNLSFFAGYNLRDFDLPNFTVYANGFHRKYEDDSLRASASNAGLHLQWRLFRPRGKENLRKLLIHWGGVDITGGVEFSRLSVGLHGQLETEVPLGSDTMPYDAIARTQGSYDLSATALTLPIEVTTSMRFAYFFWLYGGIGLDAQLGGAETEAALEGQLVGEDPRNGSEVELGRARVEVSEKGTPSPGRLRFMAGLQAEIFMVRVFSQLNLMPNRSLGVTLGLGATF